MKLIQKTVFAGRLSTSRSGAASVYVFIETKEEDAKLRLSISGVVNPTKSGDADQCGQCIDALREVSYDGDIDAPTRQRLADVWERWHLNDMRAGCEHQNASDAYGKGKHITRKWEELPEATQQRIRRKRIREHDITISIQLDGLLRTPPKDSDYRAIESHLVCNAVAEMAAETFLEADKTPEDAREAAHEWAWHTIHDIHDAATTTEKFREESAQELRRLLSAWAETKLPLPPPPTEVTFKDSLAAPCEVCGYEYGTKWLYEEVPADVLKFLAALPATKDLNNTAWRQR